jgi:surface antigen
MKIKDVIALSLACTFVAAITAHGQGLTQPWDEMTPLTPQDRATIGSTVQSQIHGKPPGTTANWTSAAGGHSGTIKLLSKSKLRGMPCERIEYRILEPGGRQQHGRYVFTSCQLPDGNWKLAQ